METKHCNDCLGTGMGVISDSACTICNGSGIVPTEDQMKRLQSDALPEDVVSFNVSTIQIPYGLDDDTRFKGTKPIYDDQDNLIGFFVMKSADRAKLFLAKDIKPFGLYLTSDLEFYFTIRVDTDRKHPFGRICGTLTEVPLNQYSVKVKV